MSRRDIKIDIDPIVLIILGFLLFTLLMEKC